MYYNAHKILMSYLIDPEKESNNLYANRGTQEIFPSSITVFECLFQCDEVFVVNVFFFFS